MSDFITCYPNHSRFKPYWHLKKGEEQIGSNGFKQYMHKEGLHYCEIDTPSHCYGECITSCEEDEDGRLFCSNGEYGSQINFCSLWI